MLTGVSRNTDRYTEEIRRGGAGAEPGAAQPWGDRRGAERGGGFRMGELGPVKRDGRRDSADGRSRVMRGVRSRLGSARLGSALGPHVQRRSWFSHSAAAESTRLLMRA